MVLSLIESYNLMPKLEPIAARKATFDELNAFHSSDFLNHCANASEDDSEKSESENFGLG